MPVIVNLGEERRRRRSRPRREAYDEDETSFLAHPAIAGSIIGLALLVLLVMGVIAVRNNIGQAAVDRRRAVAGAQQSQQDEEERLRPREVTATTPGVSQGVR